MSDDPSSSGASKNARITSRKAALMSDFPFGRDRERDEVEMTDETRRAFIALADDVDRLRHSDESTCLHRIKAGDLRALRAVLSS